MIVNTVQRNANHSRRLTDPSFSGRNSNMINYIIRYDEYAKLVQRIFISLTNKTLMSFRLVPTFFSGIVDSFDIVHTP